MHKNMSLIKCKKCGSANVKVDFGRLCTSIPAKYEYKCQDCGEVSYVDCCNVDIHDFTSEGFQIYPRPDINIPNVEDKEPKEENKGGLTGWICPKCGRCYSPYTSMCSFCICDDGYWTNTITWSGTGDIPNMFKK